MALLDGDKKNFEMLQAAFKNGDIALMECADKKTGKYVAVICATNRENNGSVEFIPFAKLFRANPYHEINPPMQDDVVLKDDFPPIAPPGMMDAVKAVAQDKHRGARS